MDRPPTTPQVSARMARQARRDTLPEIALRRELHGRGLRFRVDWPLPGMSRRRADVAFTRARVAVFVDGCFWHGCPEHGTGTKNNADWWAAKLAKNQVRDAETTRYLESRGWTVVRIWEHVPPSGAADLVELVLRGKTG